MERGDPCSEPANPLVLTLPPATLIALCGPAGCGKSTFAAKLVESHRAQGFVETMIVSSDHCRALVCDDATNQLVSRDSFDLFHYIMHKRMLQRRLTIADSTALKSQPRHRMLEQARQHQYATCLLVFNVSLEVCEARDRSRPRMVGRQVIEYHRELLQQALLDIPNEGWQQVYILDGQTMDSTIQIVFSSPA